MKTYFHAFLMCQSMFCAIPSPSQIWDEKAQDKMLPMLPLVGLELGLLWAVLDDLAMLLKLPGVVTALILGAYPFVVTGYLHLDGFMDVTDAVRSCRDLDRRREILKDSHVGSFAVIGLCLLLVTQVAFLTLGVGERKILIFLPAVSRCGSALAVMTLPAIFRAEKVPGSYPGGGGYGGNLHRGGIFALRKVRLCPAGLPSGLRPGPEKGLPLS